MKRNRLLKSLLSVLLIAGSFSTVWAEENTDGENNTSDSAVEEILSEETADRINDELPAETLETEDTQTDESVIEDETEKTLSEGLVVEEEEAFPAMEETAEETEPDEEAEVFAASEFTYDLNDDGTAKITGYTGTDTQVIIPSELGGKSVTVIGDSAFSGNGTITSVLLPETLISIGMNAFMDCTSLEFVHMNSVLEKVGDGAFMRCSKIVMLHLPNTVTEIGGRAFSGASSLEFFDWPTSLKSIGTKAFYGCLFDEIVLPSGLESIASGAFENCKHLKSIWIPKSVTQFGGNQPGVFADCTSLTTVTFEDSETSAETLGDYLFDGCTSLTSVILPSGIKKLLSYTFSRCSNLETVEYPDTLQIICSHAFDKCSKLKEVILPESVTSLQYRAFENATGLEKVYLPDSCQSIDIYAFYNCTSLTDVTLPLGLMRINKGMFQGCSKLEYINIPETVTSVYEDAFRDCIWLKEMNAMSVTSVYKNAFKHCTSLESVMMPNIRTLSEGSFDGCLNLQRITYIGAYQIGKYAFRDCMNLTELHIKGSNNMKILESAFENVSSDLTVYFYGNKAQHDAAVVESGNDPWLNARVIYDNSAQSISLTENYISISLGSSNLTHQLSVKATPDGSDMPQLVWSSSNMSVATVDEHGLVTAQSEGNTVVSVQSSDGRIGDTCQVTVTAVHVELIVVDAPSDHMMNGETMQLTAIIRPDNAYNKNVIWTTSDPSVAEVNANGLVTALQGGTVTITAASEDSGGKLTDSVTITVTQAVEGVTISKTSTIITLGRTEQLNATVHPAGATNKNVTWKSSDSSVVSVSNDGMIKGLQIGTAEVTVTTVEGGYMDVCYVTVDAVHPERITIITPYDRMHYGQTAKLSVSFEPSDTTNKNVVWSSSDETVATIDQNGVVFGTGEGLVTLTAETVDGGKTDTAYMTILFTHLTDVSFSTDAADITVGRTKQLHITYQPYDASDPFMYYESDHPEIVSVNEDGKITGISEGTAQITLTSRDGEFRDVCEVTVYPNEIYVKDIAESFEYTGSAICPEPAVYDGGRLLTKGTDYTVTYQNNINAGTAAVVVKAKGNYSGSERIEFTITPVNVNDSRITLDALAIQETGKPLTPVPNVYFEGKKLKKDKDFTIKYEDGWNGTSGQHKLYLNGKNNFCDTREFTFSVTPMNEGKVPVSKLKVTSSVINYDEIIGTDFAADIMSHVVVKNGTELLLYDTDYEVKEIPEEYKEVGSLSFIISGKGIYDGDRTVTVKIAGISLTNKAVKVYGNGPYMYMGGPVELDLAVFYMTFTQKGIETILDPEDYEILTETYQKNTKTGTATVKVAGRNGFTGTRTVSFKITPNTLTTADDVEIESPVEYSKGGAKPAVTIDGLKEGTDYTVKYSKNTKAGEGTAIVTFKGNYKGTVKITKQFTITTKNIEKTSMTVKDILYNSKPGKYRSVPVIKDTDGKTLKAGKDFEKALVYEEVILNGNYFQVVRELGPKDTVDAGTYVAVTVYGTDNYDGSLTGFYRVLPNGTDISKATFKIKMQFYTGDEIELDQSCFETASIKVEKKTENLTLGNDFEIIGYSKNINKGTATVTLAGLGNYGGTKTVSFKIGQRNMGEYWAGRKHSMSGSNF